MVLTNATKKMTVCERCHFADTVFKRMIGLLNRSALPEGEGLLIDRCYGIHTIGMRFSIDVLFLDKELRVIRAVPALRPLRTCVVKHAVYVLELPVGTIQRSRTSAGDQIQMRTVTQEVSPLKAVVLTDKPQPVPR